MQALPYSHDTAHQIGQLCVSGDWACSHGDFSSLRNISQQLRPWLPDELHAYLVELDAACWDDGDLDRAAALWEQLKRRILLAEEAWRPSDAG